jgi:hypothetical protein
MMMTIALILLQAIGYHAETGNLGSSDPWRRVPKDAVLAIVVHDPQRVVRFGGDFLQQLRADERLAEILSGDPHPLFETDELDALFSIIEGLGPFVNRIELITIVFSELSPQPRYAVEIRFRDTAKRDIQEYAKVLRQVLSLRSLLLSETESTLTSDDRTVESATNLTKIRDLSVWRLLRQESGLASFFQEIQPYFDLQYLETLEDSILVSNDQSLFLSMNELASASNAAESQSIVADRRFRRAYRQAGSAESTVATAFARPMDSLPLFQQIYTSEYLAKRGYAQLVGAWCELRLAGSWDSRFESPLRLKVAVPHTVPPEGVIKTWQAALPIQTGPDLRPLLELVEVPRKLRIQNSNRTHQWESMERFYRATGDLKALDAEIAEAERIAGDLNTFNNFWDGFELEFTFDQTNYVPGQIPRRYVRFMRTEHPALARAYVENWIRRSYAGTPNPPVRHQLGDFEGWFMTEEGHREQAILNGLDETFARTSPWITNNGRVTTDRWILSMDCRIFDLMEVKQPEEIPIHWWLEEIESSLAGFVDQLKPWWMEARFPQWRTLIIMADMRRWYIQRSVGPEGRRRQLDEHIPYKSIPIIRPVDRLYQAIEHAACVASDGWGTDVHAFVNQSGWFEWHWEVLPKLDTK